MKPLLLDTHALLWLLFADPRLSNTAEAAIADPTTEKSISMASLWEIAIKTQIGKLRLGMELETFFINEIEGRTVTVIPIELRDLLAYSALPLLHRDPFDRLLVAQATCRNLQIVSADPQIAAYGVPVVW